MKQELRLISIKIKIPQNYWGKEKISHLEAGNEDPSDTEHGNKKVISVPATLPVTSRGEGDELHYNLGNKHQVQ